MQNLHNVAVPWKKGRKELQSLLTEDKWRYCTKYGGTDDINPCIRMRFNELYPNPLRTCKSKDNRIKAFGSNMMRAYQASFVFHNKKIPSIDYEISHICGRFQQPRNYNNSWSTCIEPTHMISETTDDNVARRKCHHYIRIFKSVILNDDTPNGTKRTITVSDIQNKTTPQNRKDILKKLNYVQNDNYINNLVNHDCNCNHQRCFINYGGREKVKAIKSRYKIIYE